MNPALFVSTVLIWGATWIAIALQVGPVPVLVSVFYRFALAALILVAALAATGRLRRPPLRDQPFILAQALRLFSLNVICFYSAAADIPSGGDRRNRRRRSRSGFRRRGRRWPASGRPERGTEPTSQRRSGAFPASAADLKPLFVIDAWTRGSSGFVLFPRRLDRGSSTERLTVTAGWPKGS